MRKIWRSRAATPPPPVLNDWAASLCVSPRLAGLLWNRGLSTREAMDVFLCPGLRHLMPPQDIPGLTQAAQAVAAALASGKSLTVWGDYDVDGVTSTALLSDFFARRGFRVGHYIPARLDEGYGLSIQGIEKLAASGTDMVLTVDCGITAVAEARRARELGLSLVVTDHHLPGPELPDAVAVANPKLSDNEGRDLAGVGVAFFLAAALNRMLPGEPIDVRQFLDLAAMGTLADVVSLTGQNRIIVKNGLLLLADAARPGIFALKEASNYYPKAPLEATQVTFGLAPRINAAGRLNRAEEALSLLLAPDLETARPLAKALDELNVQRRAEEDSISGEALEQAKTQAQAGNSAMVLHAPHWHQGVIGIVASRVVDAHYRPTLIITSDNGKLKGSGRSIPEVDLHAALTSCQEHLLGFGGHHQAAGLSLAPENLDALRAAFLQAVSAQLGTQSPSPTLRLDGELSFKDIHQELLKELSLLGPFGCGNPEPVFSSPPLDVKARRVFGANHVLLEVRDADAAVTLRAKAWRMAGEIGPDVTGRKLTLAFTPRLDTYNGLASIELRVKDWAAVERKGGKAG